MLLVWLEVGPERIHAEGRGGIHASALLPAVKSALPFIAVCGIIAPPCGKQHHLINHMSIRYLNKVFMAFQLKSE